MRELDEIDEMRQECTQQDVIDDRCDVPVLFGRRDDPE